MIQLELIILAGIFAFVAYRLYRTLGEDDGPPSGVSRTTPNPNPQGRGGAARTIGRPSATSETPARFTGAAAAGLTEIHSEDPNFNQQEFLNGAESFYRMIVEAFQNGDKEALEPWLDDDVKDAWFAAIDVRTEDYTPWTLRQFRFADIEAASLRENIARIEVRFDASLARNASSQRVRETWTFMRDVTASDPNWMLDDVEAAD